MSLSLDLAGYRRDAGHRGADHTVGRNVPWRALVWSPRSVAPLGIVPHLIAAVTWTAALLRASGVAFDALRAAGVAYLLLMAIAIWRDKSRLIVIGRAARPIPGAGHRLGDAVQPAQTQADRLLLRVPSTVRATTRPARARTAPSAQQRVHGDDFRRVRNLRRGCVRVAATRHRAAKVIQNVRRRFAASFVGLSVKLATTSR